MISKVDYTNVPVALYEYAIQNKMLNQLRVYLYYKSHSNGYVKNNGKTITAAANGLKVDPKTIRKHLKGLIRSGWAEINEKGDGIRILSYRNLAILLQLKSAKGSLLYKDEIKNIRPWAYASVMKYNEKRMKFFWEKGDNKKAGLLKRSPKLDEVPPYPCIPHSLYANKVQKSKTTAHRHRSIAEKKGLVRTKKRLVNMNIDQIHKDGLREWGDYNPNCIRQVRNELFYQLPDEVRINVLLRKKSELRQICKEIRDGKKK